MKDTGTSILVVDDEPDMVELLRRTVVKELGWKVLTAGSGNEALQQAQGNPPDVVLLDIKMPDVDGMEVLEALRQKPDPPTVIMMTAYGVIELAVESIRRGAYDFITKPFDYARLVHTLRQAVEHRNLVRENLALRRLVRGKDVFQGMIGSSPEMRRIFETIQMVAPTDATVLITGESGTGKELVAKAIHELSSRSGGPFVAVNCPTLPANVLESELFGHARGAFTDARQDRKGLFQEAHGGTIFLDEIGDLPQDLQSKLLRVLQEREIKPLGCSRSFKVDVRVLASTNQDLREQIAKGGFREDLYYRLNVVSIHLPPLRQRMEDVPLLAQHFVERYASKLGKRGMRISPETMEALLSHSWPGNVRELENTIQRALILARSDTITQGDLFREGVQGDDHWPSIFHLSYREAKGRVLSHFHKVYLSRLLEEHRGNVTKAAQACGMERQALQQLLRRYNLHRENFVPQS
ncbi:MAG: sigma-54-dependent transcriptional regulator [Thermodesulfobacteriota bacterium]